MALYSRDIVGLALYPYQVEWTNYLLDVVSNRRNETIVVEQARQSGKNEGSAQLETAILAKFGSLGGAIVKCAPTWKPQIINSKERFKTRAEAVMKRLLFLRYRPTEGFIYKCNNAALYFLSADSEANVSGATASLLLEVDESQDVDIATYDKSFSPMRASTGAPEAHYGTTWSDSTLLESKKHAIESGIVKGKCFRVTPEIIAPCNPRYGDFVDSEVKRLGREHPLIKTQYFLEPLANAGRMLSLQQLRLLCGNHERRAGRTTENQIVAGLDFAGGDESAGQLQSLINKSDRDSVALTIGEVLWVDVAPGIVEPHVRVLDRYEWVNQEPVSLHSVLYSILHDKWKVNRVHCDATGIGATSTAFLAKALNAPSKERVTSVTFDSAWTSHSRLVFQFLASIGSSRLWEYKVNFDQLQIAGQATPNESNADKHAWYQYGHARLNAKESKKVKAYVPDSEGHDDLLISSMLMVDAAYAADKPKSLVTGTVDFYGSNNNIRSR
jgi:hypothetical protein